MTRFFLALLALGSFATPARSADWKPLAPADGSFAAEMPAEAKVMDREVAGPKGPLRQVTHYCKVDGALYSLQVLASPGPASLGARKAAAKAERAGYLRRDGGKLVKEQDVPAEGPPGWEVTLQGPAPAGGAGTVTSRVRMLVGDRATYTLSVVSAKDKPLPEEADRFFDSFRPAGSDRPESSTRARAAAAGPKEGGSPEEVLRAFFLAMVTNDEAKVRALALPAEGLELLGKGVAIPPEAMEEVRQQIEGRPIRALKPGDEFTLPGNRKLTVPDEDVTDDRAVMLPEGAPTPTRMRKVEGRWRVDARPFIAARKAAAAAKAKAEAKAKDGK